MAFPKTARFGHGHLIPCHQVTGCHATKSLNDKYARPTLITAMPRLTTTPIETLLLETTFDFSPGLAGGFTSLGLATISTSSSMISSTTSQPNISFMLLTQSSNPSPGYK